MSSNAQGNSNTALVPTGKGDAVSSCEQQRRCRSIVDHSGLSEYLTAALSNLCENEHREVEDVVFSILGQVAQLDPSASGLRFESEPYSLGSVEIRVELCKSETDDNLWHVALDTVSKTESTLSQTTVNGQNSMIEKPREVLRRVCDKLQAKATHAKEKTQDAAVMVYIGAAAVKRDAKRKYLHTKDTTVSILRNPEFQQLTVMTVGGAVTFANIGGAFGCVSGIVAGSAAGVMPALFTLGFSIPAGGAIGGVGGLFSGALIGGSSGGIAGFTAYKYRVQIKSGLMMVKVRTCQISSETKAEALKLCSSTGNQVYKVKVAVSEIASNCANSVRVNSLAAVDVTKTRASNAYAFATTTKAGVTASSTAAGAVVGGTTIGAAGALAGAVAGVVPAIFTFGLSIPVGAAIGLCAGTAIGGSVGAVGGGVAGYTGFTHGKAIKESVKETMSAASSKAGNLQVKAFTCVDDMKTCLSARVRASTGGSAHDKED
jgi:hypothetical protein